jgi:hypothetical protein
MNINQSAVCARVFNLDLGHAVSKLSQHAILHYSAVTSESKGETNVIKTLFMTEQLECRN